MDSALLATLVKDVVLPEILAIVRAHHNATGELPTDAQVQAALDTDADRYTRIGEEFLARTTPPQSESVLPKQVG